MCFTPEQQAQRYKKNRAALLAKSCEYYHTNKQHIQQKVTCPTCQAVVSRSYLKKHQITYKCKLYTAYNNPSLKWITPTK